MARQKLFPAGLIVLIVVFLVLVPEACSDDDSHDHCPPSPCGNIHNISYPFWLNGIDPPNCGDKRYNLSCENNQTVLYLYDGRYYVQEIDYNHYTIRLVDSSIQKDNHSFIPHYSLGPNNFTEGDPYAPHHPLDISCDSCEANSSYCSLSLPNLYQKYMVFVNCEKQVKTPLYLDISTCFKNGEEVYSSNSFLSHSKRYTYVIASTGYAYYRLLDVVDLKESCQIEQMYLETSLVPNWQNFRCTDFYDALVSGFMLSWFQVACHNSTPRDDYCNINDHANYTVRCVPYTAGPLGFYIKLWKCGKGEVSISKSCLKNNIDRNDIE
ncbi:hypothetical protein FH972_016396 [Carpinus fangiana]|uniref:Wall-associated receptor kinase galacturonan-binding domain-containing protein n=1 Tax=Carpinus fangiana TaxID=176857 RepID=A0A5N6RIR3_9ROSI|nr:hypothetical protein FH972_016396 [Carpinus fangiana]